MSFLDNSTQAKNEAHQKLNRAFSITTRVWFVIHHEVVSKDRVIHLRTIQLIVGIRRMAIGTAAAIIIAVVLILVGAVGVMSLASAPSTSRSNSSSVTYDVGFKQTAACSSSFWGVPWAVTINNVTKTQPTGTRLPITYLQGTTDRSLAEIDFSLQNGAYQYTISPSAGYFTPSSGSFVVSGNNLTIQIDYTGTSCTTTTGSLKSG